MEATSLRHHTHQWISKSAAIAAIVGLALIPQAARSATTGTQPQCLAPILSKAHADHVAFESFQSKARLELARARADALAGQSVESTPVSQLTPDVPYQLDFTEADIKLPLAKDLLAMDRQQAKDAAQNAREQASELQRRTELSSQTRYDLRSPWKQTQGQADAVPRRVAILEKLSWVKTVEPGLPLLRTLWLGYADAFDCVAHNR